MTNNFLNNKFVYSNKKDLGYRGVENFVQEKIISTKVNLGEITPLVRAKKGVNSSEWLWAFGLRYLPKALYNTILFSVGISEELEYGKVNLYTCGLGFAYSNFNFDIAYSKKQISNVDSFVYSLTLKL